jgi:hypothetical protein
MEGNEVRMLFESGIFTLKKPFSAEIPNKISTFGPFLTIRPYRSQSPSLPPPKFIEAV